MTADGCGIADVNLPQYSIKWREKSGLGNLNGSWRGRDLSNDWNTHRTAVTAFAVALTLALIAACITTLEHVDIRLANDEAPPGTIGLAKSHAPLDRAPGESVRI
jgi:hypothetical protein